MKKSEEWFNMVRRKDRSAFASKMELVERKLREVNPDYVGSYEVMHRLLGAIES